MFLASEAAAARIFIQPHLRSAPLSIARNAISFSRNVYCYFLQSVAQSVSDLPAPCPQSWDWYNHFGSPSQMPDYMGTLFRYMQGKWPNLCTLNQIPNETGRFLESGTIH